MDVKRYIDSIIESKKEVFQMIHMFRYLAVKNDENLTQKEKHINNDAVSDNFSKRLDLFFARVKIGYLSNNQA